MELNDIENKIRGIIGNDDCTSEADVERYMSKAQPLLKDFTQDTIKHVSKWLEKAIPDDMNITEENRKVALATLCMMAKEMAVGAYTIMTGTTIICHGDMPLEKEREKTAEAWRELVKAIPRQFDREVYK